MKSKIPTYVRLADMMETMIRGQSIMPGEKMPSVRKFGQQQRVSVPTALSVYAELENRGWIEARPRSGYFVKPRLADLAREPLMSKVPTRVTDFSSLDPLAHIMTDTTNPKYSPLGAALPAPSLLPGMALARIMGGIARNMSSAGMEYDIAPGCEILRRELAKRSLDWGCSLTPDDFIVTNGCTEALNLALRALTKPGDTVLVETPTYFGFAGIIRELGLKVLPVPINPFDGLDLDLLKKAISQNKVTASIFIPNFHNPLGSLMPVERKKELVRIMAQNGIPIIEDDIYGDLHHFGERPPCLKAYDGSDEDSNVIICGTFSKTLAPGYRVGYIAPGKWKRRVLKLKEATTLCNATLTTKAVGEFMHHGGYERHLRSMREALRKQVARMREAVVASFPENIALTRPEGGFVLWVELSKRVDALELFKRARASGISIAPGPLFSAEGFYQNCIRLCCGHPWSASTERSVAILGHLAKRLELGK